MLTENIDVCDFSTHTALLSETRYNKLVMNLFSREYEYLEPLVNAHAYCEPREWAADAGSHRVDKLSATDFTDQSSTQKYKNNNWPF